MNLTKQFQVLINHPLLSSRQAAFETLMTLGWMAECDTPKGRIELLIKATKRLCINQGAHKPLDVEEYFHSPRILANWLISEGWLQRNVDKVLIDTPEGQIYIWDYTVTDKCTEFLARGKFAQVKQKRDPLEGYIAECQASKG